MILELMSFCVYRLGLERSNSASDAVDVITKLMETHSSETNDAIICFVLCDANEVWLLNIFGNEWAAELVTGTVLLNRFFR